MSGGPVITFYSFKGGVGRTQAIANVAAELARRGKRVGLVDMDLESPGLHTYFSREPYGANYRTKDLADTAGLLELLELGRDVPNGWLAQLDDHLLPCWHRAYDGLPGSVRLLPAGRQDASYARRIAEFSWDRFYTDHDGYERLEELRAELLDRCDVVLLDSRTGVTDIGIVTTLQLPDVVVICFALHRQGIEGTAQAARAIRLQSEAVSRPPGQRVPRVLLLPSRVEEQAAYDHWLSDARVELDGLGELSLRHDDRIPYRSHVALGENIVVGGSIPDPLASTYERLVDRVFGEARAPASAAARPSSEADPPSFMGLRPRIADARRIAEEMLRAIGPGLASKRILELQQWVMVCADQHRGLQQRTQDIAQLAHELVPQSTIRRSILDAIPQALADWPDALDSIAALVSDHHQRWRDEHLAAARNRLIAVAEHQEELVDQELEKLEEILTTGTPHRFAAALEDLVAHVRARSRLEHLEDLTRDELKTLVDYPDEWLDHKLHTLLERRATVHRDEHDARLAHNILCLRRFAPDEDASLEHWSAYDLVLESITADLEELFEKIGQRLWLAEWTGVLRGRQELVKHLGSAAREQLLALDRDEERAAMLAPIVDFVVEGLPVLVERDVEQLRTVIESRHADPVLRRAVSRLAKDPHPSPQLLTLWAYWHTCSQRPDPDVVIAMLEILASTHPLGAFYAWAGAAVAFPEVLDAPRLAHIDIYFIISLLDVHDRRRDKALERVGSLLSDQDFVDRILGKPMGPWLVAAVAVDPVELAKPLAVAGDVCRFALRHGNDPTLSRLRVLEPISRWLDARAEHAEFPTQVAYRASKQYGVLQATLDHVSFYRGWHSSIYYEEAFRAHWREVTHEILDVHGSSEDVATRLKRLDGQAWLDSTYSDLRGAQHKVRPMEGKAKINAMRHHAAVSEAAERLLALRTEISAALSLRRCIEVDERRREAAHALRAEMQQQLLDVSSQPRRVLEDILHD